MGNVKHLMDISRQDAIWNRASLDSGGPCPRAGDRALASLLLAHGLIMNGGLVHALDSLTQSEIASAIAGFEYFVFTAASAALKQLHDDSDDVEERLSRMYWAVVPNDETLDHALRQKLLASPDEFAPLESGHHA